MALFMAIIGALSVRGVALGSMWIRLSWHARQEDTRRLAVLTWAAALPHFGELDEIRPDGSRIRITVAGTRAGVLDRDPEGPSGQG
ncbi:hypothetical protein AB0J55_20245 [Amycolatopsis sp. NPDC049688]|uniref:hypothetical protein n=1 Tax=Amycolatopsis sp. NPDC049688 TaxID=3154733 RepID=UPI00342C745A